MYPHSFATTYRQIGESRASPQRNKILGVKRKQTGHPVVLVCERKPWWQQDQSNPPTTTLL